MPLDIAQVQCTKSYQAQEHDELTLEKADILHAKTITSDGKSLLSDEPIPSFITNVDESVRKLCGCVFEPGWVEGIRLSDGERGWFPKTYVEEITSRSARLRNLRENIRIKCVTQKLKGEDWEICKELKKKICIFKLQDDCFNFRMNVRPLCRM